VIIRMPAAAREPRLQSRNPVPGSEGGCPRQTGTLSRPWPVGCFLAFFGWRARREGASQGPIEEIVRRWAGARPG